MSTLPADPADRDERWFAAFYRDQHGMVLAYARRRVPDPDDVVAEVFATAWRLRAQLSEPVRPWLIRTALHVVLHAHRSARRREALRDRLTSSWRDHPDEAEDVAERRDAAVLVAEVMPALSPADREVLRLAAWEGLDTAELAHVLECSEAAARVRLHRARRRLRVLVEHHRPDPSSLTLTESPRSAP